VRGIPSPFIKIYERGRDTLTPVSGPLLPPRKDLFAGLLGRAAMAMQRRFCDRVPSIRVIRSGICTFTM
jgi:hypothetical protein